MPHLLVSFLYLNAPLYVLPAFSFFLTVAFNPVLHCITGYTAYAIRQPAIHRANEHVLNHCDMSRCLSYIPSFANFHDVQLDCFASGITLWWIMFTYNLSGSVTLEQFQKITLSSRLQKTFYFHCFKDDI